jgi:preprotein translocase subunit YajC
LSNTVLTVLAQTAAAEPPAKPEPPSTFGPEFFIAIVIFIAAFYFFIQRPTAKAEEEKKKALEGMKKGDKVVSIGGIHGVVSKVNKEANTVTVTIAKGVDVEFNKSAVIVQVEKAEEKKAS